MKPTIKVDPRCDGNFVHAATLIKLLIVLCLLVAAIRVSGQAQPNFEQITDDDGLPNGFVTCLYQDKLGFMWFGTANGIHRYDGYQFKSWVPIEGEINCLSHSITWAIHGTEDGMIWIGTEKGLNRLDPKTETFQQFFHDPQKPFSLSHDHVYNMCSDRAGNLWVSTENGLNCLPKGAAQFQRYFWSIDPKQQKGIGGLAIDGGKTLWFGLKDTLIQFDVQRRQIIGRYPLPVAKKLPNEFSQHVRAVFVDKTARAVWVGTDENGIFCFDFQRQVFTAHFHKDAPEKYQISDNRICTFLSADAHHFWVGTYGGGLNIFNRQLQQFRPFVVDPFNPVHFNMGVVRRMWKDRAGNIWLGTSYGGTKVLLKHKKPFFNYHNIPGKPSSIGAGQPGQLSESADGRIWVPVDGWGLTALDPQLEQFAHFNTSQGGLPNLSLKQTISAMEDQRGNVWVLGFAEIWRRAPASQNWQNLRPKNMPIDWLTCQYEDHNNRHWIGTQSGLFQYDEDTNSMIQIPLRAQKDDPSQGNNLYIERIFEDEEGGIWIGTHAGLNHSTDGKSAFHFYPFQRPILSIHKARSGTLWIGTTAGLAYFDKKKKKVNFHPLATSLAGKLVISILEDEKDRLWMGSREGIICFNPQNGHTRIYNPTDGVESKQFYTSALKARNGDFYFGGMKGLLRFNPAQIQRNDYQPPVVLTNFQLHNQDVPIKGSFGDTLKWKSPLDKNITYTTKLRLRHWQNDFAFEFAALDYTAPLNNQYQYQLEGYDQEWITTDARRRFAHYTNLAPGHYTFKVRGSNGDGVWSPQSRSIAITIVAPWWVRYWARMIWVALIAGMIYAGWRYELGRRLANADAKRLKEVDDLKSQLYTNITHEFRTPLTVILGVTDILEQKTEPAIKADLETIRRNGQQLLKQVNEMLDLSKIDSKNLSLRMIQGEVIAYLRYLLESFQSLAQNKGVQLDFATQVSELQMDFDPIRLQQIVSNLLSNAIKFTPQGGAVKLMVQVDRQRLVLRVLDNGIGIPEDKLSQVFDRFFQVDASNTRKGEGTGIGLALTKELVLLMQGNIQVYQRAEGGTEFKVSLPINQNHETMGELFPKVQIATTRKVEEMNLGVFAPESAPLLLIVEDNADVVAYVKSCFNDHYRIEWAKNGQEGIEKALELIPDLVLSDVMMPEKDGYELCQSLKTDTRTSHIPVILLTAKADMDSKLDGLKLGADVYLIKPFHPEELRTQVQNLLELRQKLQAYYLQQAGLRTTHATASPLGAMPEPGREHAFIQRVKALLEADLSKQWEVPELARALQVSVSQLHRKLEALTGMHTTAFVRQVRLVKASEKLRSAPTEKIATIGYEVGFGSPNEFARRFKEVFGMTPREWREKMDL